MSLYFRIKNIFAMQYRRALFMCTVLSIQ